MYYAAPRFLHPEEEFYRAMYCPEVEQERKHIERRAGSAEAELKELKRFAFIRPDRYSEQLTLCVNFDRHMLGMMAGRMEEVKALMWDLVGEQLTRFFQS